MTLSLSLSSSLTRALAALAVTAALFGCAAADASAAPRADGRRITFNQHPATARDLGILARFEASWGVTVPSGDYWYDDVSGAGGLWGGPTRGFLGPGLGLGGGRVPANASGGGSGRLTGIFVNGRELHPLDVRGLTQLFGQAPWPGRWWVDGRGDFGPEGGGRYGNLVALVQSRQRSRGSYYRSDRASHSSVFVGSGCTAVSGRTSPSDSSSSYSYYVGC
ncbi:MAG: hypothetical protein R3B82_24595 [Sandaracinaceae bacterium]